MRIVIALGGNALLGFGEPLTAKHQRANAKKAAELLAGLAESGHELIISHDNGPQLGLLALQSADGDKALPMDMLGAQTDGMIGYLLQQELENALYGSYRVATLLTQTIVDAEDKAFNSPDTPVGPVYTDKEAHELARLKNWTIARDGDGCRRVIASPRPVSIPDTTIIELLVEHGVIVICTGGGGIPVVKTRSGRLTGIEAVIDKDLASALLARLVHADLLLMLTDVDAVYSDFSTARANPIRNTTPEEISALQFPPDTMGPKVTAACEFVSLTGNVAKIGALADVSKIMKGQAGTCIGEFPDENL